MLTETLKTELKSAILSKDEVKKDILRVALSEIEIIEVRNKKSLSDDECFSIIRKIISNNNETFAFSKNNKLLSENQVLTSYLPAVLNKDQIRENLSACLVEIRAFMNDGQATGFAMKQLKSKKLNASGLDVANVVKAIRGGPEA